DFLQRPKNTKKLLDLYDPNQYQKLVLGIARSGYAQSPSCSSNVIGMIRRYNLHEFDNKPEGNAAVASSRSPTDGTSYTVQDGHPLYDLARAHGTTVRAIQQENGLTGSQLRVGQQLLL